ESSAPPLQPRAATRSSKDHWARNRAVSRPSETVESGPSIASPPVAPAIAYQPGNTSSQPLSVEGESQPVAADTSSDETQTPPGAPYREPTWRKNRFLKSIFARLKRRDEPAYNAPNHTQPADEPVNAAPAESETVQENVTNTYQPVQTTSVPERSAVVQEPAPQIQVQENSKGGCLLTITSPNGEHLRWKSFRLHNPERFVVDFNNLSSLQNAQVVQPSGVGFLSRLRVAAFDQKTGRMVFDLAGEHLAVREETRARSDVISFIIEHAEENPLRELTRQDNVAPPPGSVVVLDAGHGGSDPGAQRGSVKEKELTLAIVQQLDKILRERGIHTILTRSSDTSVSLAERVDVTNQARPNAFLSVHINAMESTNDIHGIETYYQTPVSQSLAENIHEALVGDLKAPDRAIRKARFYVVNRTTVPAVLAEVGFISNKDERERLTSAEYQKQIATALARGLTAYLKGQTALPADMARRHDTHLSQRRVQKPERKLAEKAPERKGIETVQEAPEPADTVSKSSHSVEPDWLPDF
ncbi:MAG: N-acetylmuramoyl-L-alanine amidase, partial [Cyanobacteria bacterium]|nr:N-acetylmuramoyl-L-alanine amidase [Cyanobacteriota bacterium]